MHGASSRHHPKPSLRIELERAVAVPFFGGQASTIFLKACWLDVTCMREALVLDRLARGGALAPQTCHAAVTVGGKHLGLYLIVEAIDSLFFQREHIGLRANESVAVEGFSHEANWDASKVRMRCVVI